MLVVIPYQNAGFHNPEWSTLNSNTVVIPYQNAGFHNCDALYIQKVVVVIPYQNAGFHNFCEFSDSTSKL